MKILNLYAGIGGNRKLWGDSHEVTAVELNPDVAAIYQDHFPNDNILVLDAHQYLLKNFQKFDFIWTSPPCPTHSRARFWGQQENAVYPEMSLYQEIILLQNYFKGLFIVENVQPYYKPLIPGKKVGRHLVWSNFPISSFEEQTFDKDNIKAMQKAYGYDLTKYCGVDKTKILRNCVNPEYGKHILECAEYKFNNVNVNQIGLFTEVE